MSDESKVIRFPGAFGKSARPNGAAAGKTGSGKAADKETDKAANKEVNKEVDKEAVGADGLTEEQRKGIQIILGGMSFVLIGIKPTDRGADFFTAVHGDESELRNAQGHLDGVIARAFSRKGI